MMQPKLDTGRRLSVLAPHTLTGFFCALCVLGTLGVLGVATLAPASAYGDAPVEYLQDDVSISGGQVHHFRDAGENVSVVRGDFQLQVGSRLVTGDSGVVWIRTGEQSIDLPGVGKHNMVIYVKGNARIIDEAGAITEDNMMLVKLHVQGRLTTSATVSHREWDFKQLYREALLVREEESRMQREWQSKATQVGIQRGSEPGMVVRPSAKDVAEEMLRPETAGDQPTTGATDEPTPLIDTVDAETLDGAGEPQPRESIVEDEPQLARSVMMQAEGGLTSETDPDDPNRRVTIVPGEIYLAQGTADSDDDFLEMRADSAVIFSRKGMASDDPYEQVPYAPRLEGLNTGTSEERITGVYLESSGQSTGGVTITQGERRMRAQAVYYDFVTGRAVILQPVFRTIQEQRNIPVIVRAAKARRLNDRETKFYNAVVSTSEFHTPTYHLAAKRAVFRDETAYSSEGEQLSERTYKTSYEHATWNMRGFPLIYAPYGKTSFEEGHSPLRTARVGSFGKFGAGLETQWHLFRLLGIVKPEGFDAYANLNAYERGVEGSIDLEYQRREANREYSGYGLLDGVYDTEDKDEFGRHNEHEVPRKMRGRALLRHKEFLPRDWQIQGELSLLSDRGFLRNYYRSEFFAGKDQENLIYAKKQRDNWAFTALLKARLNHFLTQTESLPEAAGYLIGQPLLHDMLTYHAEARLGGKRYQYIDDERSFLPDGRFSYRENEGDYIARFDTLHELSLPLKAKTFFGPLNIVPYVKARLTYWSNSPDASGRDGGRYIATYGDDNGAKVRPYGQAGVRMNTHFWRVFPNVESRLWDLHQLRHIITPELVAFTSSTGGIEPHDVYPLDPEVEQHIRENHGLRFGLHQRLQTKRGPAGNRRTVDWMRFNIVGAVFANKEPALEGDGRFFFTNPEYSLQRNTIYGDFTWNISDSTAFLADASFDLDDGECDRVNAGFAVRRDPRLSYYVGLRYLNYPDDPNPNAEVTSLASMVGTFGLQYKINKKYTLNLFEQYDFLYDGGTNLGSRVSLVRKFPRWYASVTFIYDRRDEDDDLALMLMFWPEGVPEFRLGSDRFSLLGQSDKN